jgi:taurine dioxygenase
VATIIPSGQACGARIEGIDLSATLDASTIAMIRRTWLEHQVLAFPDQHLDDNAYERFVRCIGPIGDDPFIAPIPGKTHIAAIRRDANETSKPFAETWHSDWSFMSTPPAATCLYGITIPPSGGDTLFLNEHKALAEMPQNLRQRLVGKTGVHSARWAYADDGFYAADNYDGTMNIKTSPEARNTHGHPLIRIHPETGQEGIFAGSYVLGIDGLPETECREILNELATWLDRPEFCYRHRWEKDMLLMWDNRAVLHMATGGYEGHDRLLHRLTVADDPGCYL